MYTAQYRLNAVRDIDPVNKRQCVSSAPSTSGAPRSQRNNVPGGRQTRSIHVQRYMALTTPRATGGRPRGIRVPEQSGILRVVVFVVLVVDHKRVRPPRPRIPRRFGGGGGGTCGFASSDRMTSAWTRISYGEEEEGPGAGKGVVVGCARDVLARGCALSYPHSCESERVCQYRIRLQRKATRGIKQRSMPDASGGHRDTSPSSSS